jgi:hypothetical protein
MAAASSRVPSNMNVYLISRLLPFLLRRSTVLHVFGLPRFGVAAVLAIGWWPGGSSVSSVTCISAGGGRTGPQCVPGRSGERSARELCPPGLAARGASAIAIVLLEVRMRRSRSLGAAGTVGVVRLRWRSTVAVAAVLAGSGLAGCGKRAGHATPAAAGSAAGGRRGKLGARIVLADRVDLAADGARGEGRGPMPLSLAVSCTGRGAWCQRGRHQQAGPYGWRSRSR